MNKKYERLSARAKKLIEGAKKNFAHDLIKSREYLMATDPSEFNMYDKRKIGREILARSNMKWCDIKGEDFVEDPNNYVAGSTTAKSLREDRLRIEDRKIVEMYGLIETEDELVKLKNKRNSLKNGNMYFKSGTGSGKYTPHAQNLMNAAEHYEAGGYHDKALLSLKKAQEVPSSPNSSVNTWHNELRRLDDLRYRINK